LCGFETWPLALREGHRQKAINKKMLKDMYGPKGEEVTDY